MKLCAIIALILCIPGCFSDTMKTEVQRGTFFIQALVDSPALTTLTEKMTPIANSIVKEELGLAKDYDFEFFLPKKRHPHALTLYYLNDLDVNNVPMIDTALENITHSLAKPANSALSKQVNFFGDNRDELVIIIDDSKEELLALNKQIKDAMNAVYGKFKMMYDTELYDKAKSERYPYLPHMGIGRIRINSIKTHIQDKTKADEVAERIRTRIVNATVDVASELLTSANTNFSFNAICLFDLKKRECIKSYTLKN